MNDEEVLAQAYFMLGALTFLDRFVEDERYPATPRR